jgi:hypothetical protein
MVFVRRSDPLAGFTPAWGRPAALVMAFALVALIFVNFKVAVDLQTRVYVGAAWMFIAAVLVIASRIVATSRLHASLRNKWDNRCPACGYDIRGNTTGICPECGKPVRF